MESVKMSNGMHVSPQMTYEQAGQEEWGAVLVPGGIGARPWFEGNKQAREFLSKVVPKCQYVFTGKSPTSLISGETCVRERERGRELRN